MPKAAKIDTQFKPILPTPSAASDYTAPVRVGGDISVAGEDVVLGHRGLADEPSDLSPYLKSLNRR